MNYFLTTLSILLFWVHTTTAQETTPKAPKQIGIRLNKERFGTGLSAQFHIPLTKNGKLVLSQSLGFTIAHPQYDFINFNGYQHWNTRMKFISLKINYPWAANYHLGINYRINTHKKCTFFYGLDFSAYRGETASSSTIDLFYDKIGYYSYNILPKIGMEYKLNKSASLMWDFGIGYSIDNTDNFGDGPRGMNAWWYNAGISLLWNIKTKAKQ